MTKTIPSVTSHTLSQHLSAEETKAQSPFQSPRTLTQAEYEAEYQRQLQQFKQDCGIDVTGYGPLELAGILANYKKNRLLKTAGEAHSSSDTNANPVTSSTRDATMVGINSAALSRATKEDQAVIRALTGNRNDITSFRVKQVKYGNNNPAFSSRNAVEEVLSQKLYDLTGEESPHTVFMIHVFTNPHDNPGIEIAPKLAIASPMATGYSDLGAFLTSSAIERFLNPKYDEQEEELFEEAEKEEQEVVNEEELKWLKSWQWLSKYKWPHNNSWNELSDEEKKRLTALFDKQEKAMMVKKNEEDKTTKNEEKRQIVESAESLESEEKEQSEKREESANSEKKVRNIGRTESADIPESAEEEWNRLWRSSDYDTRKWISAIREAKNLKKENEEKKRRKELEKEERLKTMAEWRRLKEQVDAINDQEIITDLDKLRRVELYSQIYDLLPDYLQQEIEKAFASLKFIHNWDDFNYHLFNTGIIFTLDHQGRVIFLQSVVVDFGNSGLIGFGGKFKELSYDRANTEAKPLTAHSKDYDPSLKLTDEEKAFMESNSLKYSNEEIRLLEAYRKRRAPEKNLEAKNLESAEESKNDAELNDNEALRIALLKKSIIFKTSHHIMKAEAGMEVGPTTGLLTFSDLPRNLPFGVLLKKVLQEKTRLAQEAVYQNKPFSLSLHRSGSPEESPNSPLSAEDLSPHLESKIDDLFSPSLTSDHSSPRQERTAEKTRPTTSLIYDNPSFYRDSEIETAFRFSLIPDEAIDFVNGKWNLCERYPLLFPLAPELENPDMYRGKNQTQLFKDRKNALKRLIPHEIIDEWVVKNRAQAIDAEQRIRMGMLRQCGSTVINEENSFAARIEALGTKKVHEITVRNPTKWNFGPVALWIKKKMKEMKEADFEIGGKLAEKLGAVELAISKVEGQLSRGFPTLSDEDRDSLLDALNSSLEQNKCYKLDIEKEINEQKAYLKQQAEMNFIVQNLPHWKKLMGLDLSPNYDPFDLTRIEREFDLTIRANLESLDVPHKEQMISTKRAEFIITRFVEILDQLSPPLELNQLPPSPTIATASIANFNLSNRRSEYISATI